MMFENSIFRQIFALLPVYVGNMMSGMNYAWASANTKYLLSSEFGVPFTYEESIVVASLMHVGRIIGALCIIGLFTRSGRKLPIVLHSVLTLISCIIVVINKSVRGIFIARFICGFGLSMLEGFTAVYVGEVSAKNCRGMISTLSLTVYNIGILLQYMFGVYLNFEDASVIMLVLATILLLSCYCLVETPYYLASTGHNEKALRVLCWLRASDAKHVENEFHGIAGMKLITNLWQLLYDIKKLPEVRRSFQMIIVLQLVMTTLMSLFVSFANFIVPNSASLSSEQFGLIFCVTQVIMSLLSSFCVDRFGRRTMLIVGLLLALVLNGAVAVMYYVEEVGVTRIPYFSDIIFGVIMMYLISFTFALQPAVIALRSEVFPLSYKILCINIAFSTGSAVYCAVTWLFMKSMKLYGMYVNFSLYFAWSFVGLLFVAYNVPETKGKTLAQIQEILGKSRMKKSGDV